MAFSFSELRQGARRQWIAQRKKYAGLGYGKYISLAVFIFYFLIYPRFLALIWPYICDLMPVVPLYVVTVVVLNIIIIGFYNLVMYFVYTLKIPFFEQYRVNINTPWPWEQNPQEWRKILMKSIGVVSLNILIVSPTLSFFDALKEFNIHMKMDHIPSLWTNIWQFALFLIAEEIVFYLVHRAMHIPSLYWIHKQHHEYNVTIALAAQYAHPIEQLLANSVPAGIAYKFLSNVYPVHIFTILIWLTFRLFETCDGHSGYEWPWAQSSLLPFSAGGSYHYFHHKQNVGNYGAILNVIDTAFGTNVEYDKFQEKQAAKNE